MTGPYEVLARLPDTKVHLVAHSLAPVKTDRGMEIVPTVTLADCPPLDLIMVPPLREMVGGERVDARRAVGQRRAREQQCGPQRRADRSGGQKLAGVGSGEITHDA